MGLFEKKYNVNKVNEEDAKKSGGNSYNYKVTNRKGEVSYLSKKGVDALKSINKRKEKGWF